MNTENIDLTSELEVPSRAQMVEELVEYMVQGITLEEARLCVLRTKYEEINGYDGEYLQKTYHNLIGRHSNAL